MIELFIFAIALVYIMTWIFGLCLCLLIEIRSSKTYSNQGENHKPQNSKRLNNYIVQFASGYEKWMIQRVSRIPSHTVRNIIYRTIFRMKIGKDVVIYSGVIFRKPSNIIIGNGTIIGDRCELDGRGGLVIGSNCNISSDVRIWTAQHDYNSSSFDYVKKNVIIGERCWISSNCIILPGSIVQDGVVVAAGAVLTKSTEAYSVYAGIPAKRIIDRASNLTYSFNGSHDWFV